MTEEIPNERIRCPICNREFKVIMDHTRQAHMIITEEYKQQHPDEKLVCNETHWKWVKHQKETNPALGMHHSLESRKKISEGSKAMWRRHSEETKQRIGRNHLGKPHTEEAKQKMMEAWMRRRARESIATNY